MMYLQDEETVKVLVPPVYVSVVPLSPSAFSSIPSAVQ